MYNILVNGCSFTSGQESNIAWPSLVSGTINISVPGASNDYILRSTVQYLEQHTVDRVIIAWTSPNRIEISRKHLTAGSSRKYGDIVDHVFREWDTGWAFDKFLTQVAMMHKYLDSLQLPHIFVSAFDIQSQASACGKSMPDCYLGWPGEGLVEWMGDCARGPGGHPLDQGHHRIATKINEHIGNIGWIS